MDESSEESGSQLVTRQLVSSSAGTTREEGNEDPVPQAELAAALFRIFSPVMPRISLLLIYVGLAAFRTCLAFSPSSHRSWPCSRHARQGKADTAIAGRSFRRPSGLPRMAKVASSSVLCSKAQNIEVAGGPNADISNMLGSATRLRLEAEALEAEMGERRRGGIGDTERNSDAAATKTKQTYTSLDDSEWTVTYRYASEPPPKDDASDQGRAPSPAPITYYSGKVDVKFRSDGYSELLATDEVKNISYAKFWGWDEEEGKEDGLHYLLFSADVELPDSDSNAGNRPERFYFQARVDRDERTGEISLSDGKVTVKRDLEPPGGFWGVFSGQGILAQFRACGDFICNPR